jgi:hypothetical protein
VRLPPIPILNASGGNISTQILARLLALCNMRLEILCSFRNISAPMNAKYLTKLRLRRGCCLQLQLIDEWQEFVESVNRDRRS